MMLIPGTRPYIIKVSDGKKTEKLKLVYYVYIMINIRSIYFFTYRVQEKNRVSLKNADSD